MNTYNIPLLPLREEIETRAILKKTISARGALAEMKGVALSIPNERILINTLSLQEAKDSSEIENIITTQDELFQSNYAAQKFRTLAAKEVYNYVHALLSGFEELKLKNLLTLNQIIKIQSIMGETEAGFRKLIGTELKNEHTGETVYRPPQSYDEILYYMRNLEQFINDNTLSDLDPLIKLAIIHHQFESIHPFYDGNGRTGRIINVLYLIKEQLLDLPVLYLSRYINQNKGVYYNLLQEVRTQNAWESWIMFILEGIEQTSKHTIQIIQGIKEMMLSQKQKIRNQLPHIYSQDLLNNIFKHPYTKIDFVMQDLNVSRLTATRYLNALTNISILSKEKHRKDNYYINTELFNFLMNVSAMFHLQT